MFQGKFCIMQFIYLIRNNKWWLELKYAESTKGNWTEIEVGGYVALLMAENAPYFGEVHVLPIGLHPQFADTEKAAYELLTLKGIVNIFKKRSRFAHKGTYGTF